MSKKKLSRFSKVLVISTAVCTLGFVPNVQASSLKDRAKGVGGFVKKVSPTPLPGELIQIVKHPSPAKIARLAVPIPPVAVDEGRKVVTTIKDIANAPGKLDNALDSANATFKNADGTLDQARQEMGEVERQVDITLANADSLMQKAGAAIERIIARFCTIIGDSWHMLRGFAPFVVALLLSITGVSVAATAKILCKMWLKRSAH